MSSTLFITRSLFSSALLACVLAACGDDRVPVPPGENKDAANVQPDALAVVTNPDAANSTFPDATGNPVTCDMNPAACEPGRLKGSAPACMCLGGCEANYMWNGTTCIALGFPDAAAADDAAATADDAAATADDAAATADDAAATADDAAVNPTDDAAVANPDAAAVVNADATVVVNADAGTPPAGDAAVVVGDAGTPNRDAAVVVADGGGPRPDGGFTPSGDFEADPCNPSIANTCLQEPGMICQSVSATDPTLGRCLKTCNIAQNVPGGSGNAACIGLGPNCLDIGLLPAGGRCLNAVGAYEELVQILDVCDTTIPNLFNIGGACWPLCTVTPSPTDPINVSCSGGWGTCINEVAFNAGDNVLAACGERVTRSSTCADGRGSYCAANTDLCVNGVCHQTAGTTCTGAPACTVAGEVCTTAGTPAIAFCHRPCGLFQSGACLANQTCELTSFGGAPQGSCRAIAGAALAGDDCSDVLAQGTRANDCAAGTTCIPFGGAAQDDFTQASCLQFCSNTNATAPLCNGAQTCNDFGAPFNDFGICF